jgi:hypothetical protein
VCGLSAMRCVQTAQRSLALISKRFPTIQTSPTRSRTSSVSISTRRRRRLCFRSMRRAKSRRSTAPAKFALKEGPGRDHDARLQAQRQRNTVCGPRYRDWHNHRRMPAPPQGQPNSWPSSKNRPRDSSLLALHLIVDDYATPHDAGRDALPGEAQTLHIALHPESNE